MRKRKRRSYRESARNIANYRPIVEGRTTAYRSYAKVQRRESPVFVTRKAIKTAKKGTLYRVHGIPTTITRRMFCKLDVRKKRRAYFGFMGKGISKRLVKRNNRFTANKLCRSR